MSKMELFLELAKPDNNGVSRWVKSSEFVGNYKDLALGNGGSWCRANSSLAKKYIVEFDKSLTSGNSIDAIRLNGFNKTQTFNQTIRRDIKEFYKDKKCVMLGVNGNSENTKIEIDHKDGRKNDWRVSNQATQELNDFQPLCKAANDVKRQICKNCKETNKRWNARNILGNPYDFYAGNEDYTAELGCVGCYQYDPVEYRKQSVKRISKEASENCVDFIMKKLYGNEK
ncbi:ICEA Protein [Campylobacter hyointestinalis subsp. hyointestinalis]|uniref:ICEA Protein n=2 Tax=Campylobacter hyointestinalis TaxID=198 RepID=A0A9W5ATL8_CAMHY|nr:ICEA Protein [Campylobacter hyointestinalis subsp. hyointestinalis]CUU71285.1 ICEA Protein [Campylobacter hyointestinalis subsp. hyointestinalis]CUU85360.1 ICEA Protein [Campylobacter hyointestinalis subsp. hyointestinalis]